MSNANLTTDPGKDQNPDNTNEELLSPEDQAQIHLEQLIKQQGVKSVTAKDLEETAASNFWPENESIDDFLRFVRESRTEGRQRPLP